MIFTFYFKKKFRFLETPFPDINDGIIVDANIGNKNEKIPKPFWFKVTFLSKTLESLISFKFSLICFIIFSSISKIFFFLFKALLIP